MNPIIGTGLDLFYGLALARIFLLVRDCMPAESGPGKGLIFALTAWFLRGFMGAVSQAMMFKVPARTTLYAMSAALLQMAAVGLIYGVGLGV